MDEIKILKFLKEKLKENIYYDDLYYEPLNFFDSYDLEITKKDYSKIHICLLNIPCAGFGDIINCSSFYQYLKLWYPGIRVTICTTEINKFKSLKIKGIKFVELIPKNKSLETECGNYDNYKFKNKSENNFDIIGIVPLLETTGIDGYFHLSHLQKLIPYANYYNTFTVSEYNGATPPYTFPTGVGKGKLGLFLTNLNIEDHNLIEKPYLMTYTAGIDYDGVSIHAISCFFSFLEMTTFKYKKFSKLQIIIPTWVNVCLQDNPHFKSKMKKIIQKNFKKISFITDDKKNIILSNEKGNHFIIRGDILPQPRNKFISLIKNSLKDVLLTGDQSITDALSYSRMDKRIWYEVAPWKKEFIYELSKVIPNKKLQNFRTSCGCIRCIQTKINNTDVIKKYDFRILGKKRMDSVLTQYNMISNKSLILLKYYYYCLEKSRYKETALKKLEKYIVIK